LGDDCSTRLEEQAKERELERLRKDKTKAIAVIEKMVAELEQMQAQVLETEEGN